MRGVVLAYAMLAALLAYALWCRVRVEEIRACADGGGFWTGARCEAPEIQVTIKPPTQAAPPLPNGPAL